MTDPLGQSQVLPYLAGLSRLGYEFTLLSFEKKDRFAKTGPLIQSICEQHNIRWEHCFFTRRPPLISKWYDSWQMKRKVKSLHRKYRFDFTHCRSYVPAAAGLALQKSTGVPYLFDMRGFWVDERVDNGQWKLSNPLFKLLYKFFKKKEKQYLKSAAHIISLTENGKEELAGHYAVPAERITVIPCCADLAHFDYNSIDQSKRSALQQELGIAAGDKILSYLGSLGGWYLTAEMLDFFSELKKHEPAARFLFITHDKKEDIVKLAAARNIAAQDILVAPATRQQVPLMLSLSEWSIFFIKDAYSKKASSPTKQGEIMAMGIPLICNDIGDTGKIVETAKAGLLVREFSAAEYKRICGLLPLNRPAPDWIREAGKKYYSLENGVEKYQAVYKHLTN
jgi:glycosyltransferase involved in cell wall biosynthesis